MGTVTQSQNVLCKVACEAELKGGSSPPQLLLVLEGDADISNCLALFGSWAVQQLGWKRERDSGFASSKVR